MSKKFPPHSFHSLWTGVKNLYGWLQQKKFSTPSLRLGRGLAGIYPLSALLALIEGDTPLLRHPAAIQLRTITTTKTEEKTTTITLIQNITIAILNGIKRLKGKQVSTTITTTKTTFHQATPKALCLVIVRALVVHCWAQISTDVKSPKKTLNLAHIKDHLQGF